MNREAALIILKRYIGKNFKSPNAAAKAFEISATHLGRVLNEGHEIPDSALECIGLEKEKVTNYYKSKDIHL